MKKALVALSLIAVLAGGAYAQTGSVTGLVVDIDGFAVANAKVSLWQEGVCLFHVFTDDAGAFAFTDIPVGVYALHAGKKKVGNAAVEVVEVLEGQIVDVGTLTLEGQHQAAPGKWQKNQQD